MLLAGLYLCLCASLYLKPRPAAPAQGDCMLYYIINTDGMKGLGHTILMLKDEDGRGTVISFNGMQRTLGESLMGQSGVGKMSIETMDAEDTAAFLQTARSPHRSIAPYWPPRSHTWQRKQNSKRCILNGFSPKTTVKKIPAGSGLRSWAVTALCPCTACIRITVTTRPENSRPRQTAICGNMLCAHGILHQTVI